MKITLRAKLIIFSTLLVTIVMVAGTYLFTIRELDSKRAAMELQIQRIARNIATLQLVDRQGWGVYQNFISHLMNFNDDIVYIAIYDDRNTLRAHSLNRDLIDINQPIVTRRTEAQIVRQLDRGAIAPESSNDLRTERVNIQVGDRVLGSVHVGFSLIEINQELRRGILLNVSVGIFFVILFSVLSALVSRRLTRPLEQLNAAMAAVNEGDLSRKVVATTHDEIAELATSFNNMIEGLRERQIIENLGYELSATFRLDSLAVLVRDRLKDAIGAGSARLYIRDDSVEGGFKEITVTEEERHQFPVITVDRAGETFLLNHHQGFMIHDAPPEIMTVLHHRQSDEGGLVIPMIVKDELFGMLFFALPPHRDHYSKKQILFAATLASQAALALENALLYEALREQERMKRELEIARDVQQKLLPNRMPDVQGFIIEGFCIPAFEVGGDYFDFFRLDDEHLGVVVADVSGKGTSASFYMAELKGMMMHLTATYPSPKSVLMELNRKLYETLDRKLFITMTYGVLNHHSGELVFSRAGHNSLLKISSTNSAGFLTPAGMGLGMDAGSIFNKILEEKRLVLQPGDTLVFYTDGIVEAMNDRQEEFGEERLLQTLRSYGNTAGMAVEKIVMEELRQFLKNGQPHDDITMVTIRRDK